MVSKETYYTFKGFCIATDDKEKDFTKWIGMINTLIV